MQFLKDHDVTALLALPNVDTANRDLLDALVPDPAEHPERSAATLARVEEILHLLLPDSEALTVLLADCRALTGNAGSTEPLTLSTAMHLAALLSDALNPEELHRAAELISACELSTDEVIALHRRFKIPVSHLEDDLLPIKGEGASIVDSLGKKYVDLDSNYSATNLGNANGEIARGLYNQASLLISQKEDRIQVARARFLKEIGDLLPGDLSCFYWQNSGGEAVDKALKIAKAYTQQTGVIAFEGGFHGRTHGAVAVTHNEAYRKPFGLHEENWVHFAPFGDLAAVESILAKGQAKIVITELVQGEEGGVRAWTPEQAKGLRALCDRYDALLIVDEVQTGFGRTADGPDTWFACQSAGITPDLMTIGKSFGGGYPVTAVVTHPTVSQAMKGGYDGSTFGGNPMAMTAALIATRQMKKHSLPENVLARREQFLQGLSEIQSPYLKGFRAYGLMIAVDLPKPSCVPRVQALMKEFGAHSSLSTGASMRWMPPLIITEEEVDQVIEALAVSLAYAEGDPCP